MQSHKLSLKFFADDTGAVNALPSDTFLHVFHSWIQRQAFPGHLLIDVADYAHVPNGPGTVLVAHEANIHLDREEGVGLLYVRKQPVAGATTFRERLAEVFRAALVAADKLQSDSDLLSIRFRTGDMVFRINDRLLAPNTEATFAAVSGDLQAFLAELFGSDVALEHRHDDPRRLFEVRIRPSAKRSVSDLLARLESPAAAAR